MKFSIYLNRRVFVMRNANVNTYKCLNIDIVLYVGLNIWNHADNSPALLIGPSHDTTNKLACPPSEDSDQPWHILIRLGLCQGWLESSLCAQWVATCKDPSFLHLDSEDWSDWANRSLRWAHMPFCWFCHEMAQLSEPAMEKCPEDVCGQHWSRPAYASTRYG